MTAKISLEIRTELISAPGGRFPRAYGFKLPSCSRCDGRRELRLPSSRCSRWSRRLPLQSIKLELKKSTVSLTVDSEDKIIHAST